MELVRMSHSRYETYANCGERYRLEKVLKVPRTPSIYAVAGTAFHTWTEDWDLDRPAARTLGGDYWSGLLEGLVRAEEEKSGFPLAQWDTPARGADANQKAYEKFRGELGPEMIDKYIDWRRESGWEIAWVYGRPAVELEITYAVGTVQDIAIIDRIFTTPEDLMVGIDLKTWSKKRVTAQLPSYVVACRQVGIPVTHAAYYEARKGEVTDLETYQYWDEARLAALHEQAAHMIAAGFFLPRPSEDCGSFCSVRRHCQFALS